MGDQSLMKKLLLSIVPLYVTAVYADLSVQQIENMIQKIHLKREGISLDTLEQTKEPFVRIKKEDNVTVMEIPEVTEEDVKLSLHAIMADKAYINDGWKKVDDVILGYTIKYIGKKGVVLRNGNTIKKLFLGKPKDDIIILEERD
jgi:hypothetical protein